MKNDKRMNIKNNTLLQKQFKTNKDDLSTTIQTNSKQKNIS